MNELLLLMQYQGAVYQMTVLWNYEFECLFTDVKGIIPLRMDQYGVQTGPLMDRDIFSDLYKEAESRAKDHLFCNLFTKIEFYGVAI